MAEFTKPTAAQQASAEVRQRPCTSRLAWTSLVLGGAAAAIGGITCAIFFQRGGITVGGVLFNIGPLAFPLGAIAIIVSIFALRRIAKNERLTGRGLARIGMVLAIVGLVSMSLVIRETRRRAREYREQEEKNRSQIEQLRSELD